MKRLLLALSAMFLQAMAGASAMGSSSHSLVKRHSLEFRSFPKAVAICDNKIVLGEDNGDVREVIVDEQFSAISVSRLSSMHDPIIDVDIDQNCNSTFITTERSIVELAAGQELHEVFQSSFRIIHSKNTEQQWIVVTEDAQLLVGKDVHRLDNSNLTCAELVTDSIFASHAKCVNLYSLENGRAARRQLDPQFRTSVQTLRVSPDGTRIAGISAGAPGMFGMFKPGEVHVWCTVTGANLWSFATDIPHETVHDAAFIGAEKMCIATDRRVILVDTTNSNAISEIQRIAPRCKLVVTPNQMVLEVNTRRLVWYEVK